MKWIPSAHRRKFDAMCLLSENISTRPTRPMRPTRSGVRVPSLRENILAHPMRPMRSGVRSPLESHEHSRVIRPRMRQTWHVACIGSKVRIRKFNGKIWMNETTVSPK
jgi:hypothetical protein